MQALGDSGDNSGCCGHQPAFHFLRKRDHGPVRIVETIARLRRPPLASLPEGHVMAQYVFTMNRVGKIVPPKRHILKNISLSFFPGAKIGMLGVNGSGMY